MLLMIFFYNNFNFVSGISIDFWKEGWIKNFVIAVNPFIKLYLYIYMYYLKHVNVSQ